MTASELSTTIAAIPLTTVTVADWSFTFSALPLFAAVHDNLSR